MADFLQTAVKGPHGIHHFAKKVSFGPSLTQTSGTVCRLSPFRGSEYAGVSEVFPTQPVIVTFTVRIPRSAWDCASHVLLLNTPNSRSGRHARAVPLDALAPETLMEEGPVHIGDLSVEVTEPAFGNSPGNLTPPQQHLHVSREIQVLLPNQSAPKRSNLEIGPSCPGRSHPHNT
ncbi:uncharacterized protein EI90DRAFT_3082881 [Cantharellus anzutake]|uniref:uncharacterized protein n=1 Tax=Cantharellus anzutake TaxID=1750568 RepID=UPI0019046121|nr:uncharacterized protein EI90DRAFT_3082881 [Cantharellus anzutake]KAF8318875.1 hypothetical protein EI90DRAFT_3082881 [Cantharellus anzutake]